MELKHEEFFSYQYYVKYVCIVFSYPGYTELQWVAAKLAALKEKLI